MDDNRDEEPPKKKMYTALDEKRRNKFNVEDVFEELREKHGIAYTRLQLKLWARMIVNDIHDSYDQPPQVPMITGIVPKPSSVSEVIANAATTFAKASVRT